MLDLRSALLLIADTWPGATAVIEREEAYWAPEEVPETGLFADLGFALVRDLAAVPDADRRRLFGIIEALVVCGTHEVVEAASTGFLEALLSASSDDRLDFREVAPWLGPESAERCRSLDEFIGVESPGLWPRPPEVG